MMETLKVLLLIPCTVLIAFILSVMIEMVKILKSKRYYRLSDLDYFRIHEMEGMENPSNYYEVQK